jgi:CDP-glucose 4,6-dehydratase
MELALGQRLRELHGPLLLTGHTGFKGTWMTFLLEHLGVPQIGYSLPPEKGSLFDRASRTGAIPEVFEDIRDYQNLEKFIDVHKPSTIIHMAAQPLVLESYENPRETFDVNIMGTVNVLDIAFRKNFVKSIIVVTTDKVYKNDNSRRAFVETDPLEGKDPYSASKVGTEAVVAAWQQIAREFGGPNLVSVRAGNVIGGGDFAKNRIIPDIIRGIVSGNPIEIRNPESTRPWQHVLDPCKGYVMTLETSLLKLNQSNLNFGPKDENLKVGEVAQIAKLYFPSVELNFEASHQFQTRESSYLSLDSSLSLELLNWSPTFTQEEAVKMSFAWWRKALSDESLILELCLEDVRNCLKEKP